MTILGRIWLNTYKELHIFGQLRGGGAEYEELGELRRTWGLSRTSEIGGRNEWGVGMNKEDGAEQQNNPEVCLRFMFGRDGMNVVEAEP